MKKTTLAALALFLLVPAATATHDDDTAERDNPECDGPQEMDAEHDGKVNVVSWSAYPDADAYNVYGTRINQAGPAGGGFDLIATVEGDTTTYRDADVEQGETYRYFATAVVDGEETDSCDLVEITSIPVYPSVFAAGLAVAIGVVGYAGLRRHR